MYLLFVVFCFRVYLGYHTVSQVGSCSVFIVCRVLFQSVSRVSHSKPGGILQRIYCLSCVCFRVYLGYHTVSQVGSCSVFIVCRVYVSECI